MQLVVIKLVCFVVLNFERNCKKIQVKKSSTNPKMSIIFCKKRRMNGIRIYCSSYLTNFKQKELVDYSRDLDTRATGGNWLYSIY